LRAILIKRCGTYFPDLEGPPAAADLPTAIRKLRVNGIAHGNRFNIDANGQKRLARHPANNRDAAVKSPLGTVFEITPSLAGKVLFNFIGAADVSMTATQISD